MAAKPLVTLVLYEWHVTMISRLVRPSNQKGQNYVWLTNGVVDSCLSVVTLHSTYWGLSPKKNKKNRIGHPVPVSNLDEMDWGYRGNITELYGISRESHVTIVKTDSMDCFFFSGKLKPGRAPDFMNSMGKSLVFPVLLFDLAASSCPYCLVNYGQLWFFFEFFTIDMEASWHGGTPDSSILDWDFPL